MTKYFFFFFIQGSSTPFLVKYLNYLHYALFAVSSAAGLARPDSQCGNQGNTCEKRFTSHPSSNYTTNYSTKTSRQHDDSRQTPRHKGRTKDVQGQANSKETRKTFGTQELHDMQVGTNEFHRATKRPRINVTLYRPSLQNSIYAKRTAPGM